jgi:hypothetical protein
VTAYAPDLIIHSGVTPAIRTAASGDQLTNPGDHKILRVINGAGAPITLTIAVPGTTGYGVSNPVKTVTVTNGTAKNVLILASYGDPSIGGNVALSWSSPTTVTFEYTGS